MIAELGPDSEVAVAVREVLEKAPDPLSARQIGVRLRSRYALSEEDIMALLAGAVALGRAFRYGSTQDPRYWWGDDDAYAQALMARQLARKPLTAVELHKHVAARIPAYPVALTRLLFDDDDKATAEAQRDSPVAPAEPSPSAQDKARTLRTEDGFPVHSFQTMLADLATMTKNRIRPKLSGADSFDQITRPTPLQRKAFDLLGVKL